MASSFGKLSKAAHYFRELKKLKPGTCLRISRENLADLQVPANPLDRQTPEYIVQWLIDRLPFKVTADFDVINLSVTFRRDNQIVTPKR